MVAIASVIKYEGDNSTFIWKHPCEDFNTSSQLIVHEAQEAILFLNGQALDLFGPGRYTLETENIPILRHLITFQQAVKAHSTARSISSTKPSKWQFAGERTARYSM